jgi:hypothetical protein
MELSPSKSNERPAALASLSAVASDLDMLISCANKWMPEEDWRPLVEEIHAHLCAMYLMLKRMANKNAEALDGHFSYNGYGFVVRLMLLTAQDVLMDRTWSEGVRTQQDRRVREKLKRLYGPLRQEPDADEELEGGAA